MGRLPVNPAATARQTRVAKKSQQREISSGHAVQVACAGENLIKLGLILQGKTKGAGNEESYVCCRGAGARPYGHRSCAGGLRHREVQNRILPHLRPHRFAAAGRNVCLVCLGPSPLLSAADFANCTTQARTRRRSALVLALLTSRLFDFG